MTTQILAIQTGSITGVLPALITVVFGFVLPRLLDYFVGQNFKILKELMDIRKEVDSSDPTAITLDEIIRYRRARYLERQVSSYEKMKKEDIEEATRNASSPSGFRKKAKQLLENPIISGTLTVISLLIACIAFSTLF